MKHPIMHSKLNSAYVDRWNPYLDRDYQGHHLHKPVFNGLLDAMDNKPGLELAWTGCLDAPDEVPCGSTLRVKTVGGWEREEYNRQWRWCEDWRAALQAQYETAEMLKNILAEVDNN